MDKMLKMLNGFSITGEKGNNAFSWKERQQKEIFVPPLIKGSLCDLQIGDKSVFCEIDEGIEKSFCGLKQFIYWEWQGKPVFIFDNHNHAFFFWAFGLSKNHFPLNAILVHTDQHTDMRKPGKWLPFSALTNPRKVFEYTNFELNVGNFIQPALNVGIFSSVEMIDSSSALQKSFTEGFVFDLDIDFFSPDMAYIPRDYKIEKIREWLKQASFITIATSPFFIDQKLAIETIYDIFNF